MHGLIFKIKESHRQDQSESFVIYVEQQDACTQNDVYMLSRFLFHNKSNEITSLWPVFFFDIYRSQLTSIYVVSSRRNKTNPHHRNKFIPVLHTTHLQAFKPKLSTYDQFWTTDQQDVSFSMIRVHMLKHFQPHSLLCQLWCRLCHWFVFHVIYRYMTSREKLTKQLRQTFFLVIHNSFHTASQL